MIITRMIEWLWKERGDSATMLRTLLANHPALDYADELLEIVKGVAELYERDIPSEEKVRTLRAAQALIAKIEGKK